MDSKQIKNLSEQANTLVDNIKKLQTEITNYQSGHQAFSQASTALVNLAKEQTSLTSTIKASVENLNKVDSVSILQKVETTAHELTKMSEELDSLFDRLADITKTLDTSIKTFESQVSKTQENYQKALDDTKTQVTKLYSEAAEKIQQLYNNAENNIAKIIQETREKLTIAIDDTEEKTTNHYSEKIQNLETTAEKIAKNVQALNKDISNISSKLDDGVKIKKRFF